MAYDVGKRIKERRKELGISAEDIADEIGKNKTTIYRYERGAIEKLPTEVLSAIAKILKTTPEYLMGWEDDPVDYEEWLEESGYSIPHGFHPDLDDAERAKKYFEYREALEQDWKNEAEGKTDFGSNVSAANRFMFSQTVQIPVYGSVPAGVPIEAVQDIDGYVNIPADWADHGRYMALTVHGSSMYPKYLDGDTVVIKIQDYIPSGQDGVVYVNGYDATLKTVINEVDGSTTLRPVNPEYETKNYKPGIVKPLGLVKLMIREL